MNHTNNENDISNNENDISNNENINVTIINDNDNDNNDNDNDISNDNDDNKTKELDSRLFTDKYYPKSLKDLDYNFELNRDLINLAKIKDLPHLMFCGIPGSGKKTRALLFLREKFGPSVMRVKKKEVSFKYSNKVIDIQLLYSNYHYQIDPSIHGVYDRGIIQDLVKKIMQLQLGITDMSHGSHKVIVVENADKLTQEAQQSLRRTLELYVKSCRFIFLVGNEGNMIEPLQSRCLKLRVPAPTLTDIRGILENIADSENINISGKSLDYLIKYSDKNLNTLINQLQILNLKLPEKLANPNGISIEEISDIHAHIKIMIDKIFTGTSISILTEARQYIYDLLVNCVCPTEIVKLIFEEILTRIPDSGFKYKYEIIKIAKKYDHTIRLGSKPIYHIEAMVVHLFNTIKTIQKKINSNTTNNSNTVNSANANSNTDTTSSTSTSTSSNNTATNSTNNELKESANTMPNQKKRGPKLKVIEPKPQITAKQGEKIKIKVQPRVIL